MGFQKEVFRYNEIYFNGGNIMETQEAYKRAQKRVAAKVGFYIHFAIYLIVSIALISINLNSPSENLWSKWPVMGWGIGILFHAMSVYVFYGKTLITRRMIEKEMKREAIADL